MSPATEPFAENFEKLNLTKQTDLSICTFGKYLSWCKLFDIKRNTFKDSNRFFINWLSGSDYDNFHYIYDPPYWKFSYYKEKE